MLSMDIVEERWHITQFVIQKDTFFLKLILYVNIVLKLLEQIVVMLQLGILVHLTNGNMILYQIV